MEKASRWLFIASLSLCAMFAGRSLQAAPAKVDTRAALQRAAASKAAGDYEAAWKDYTLAIENKADAPNLLAERALVDLELGDAASAALDCTVQLEKEPSNARAMAVFALARLVQGRDEVAEIDMKAALTADPRLVREFEGRTKSLLARRKQLVARATGLHGPVADELVGVWKGSLAKDDAVTELEMRLESRGFYKTIAYSRIDGRMQTRDGVITFKTNTGQAHRWNYEIRQDGAMLSQGKSWTHEYIDDSASQIDSRLLGVWRWTSQGQYSGSTLFAVQPDGVFFVQNNFQDTGSLKAAEGRWVTTPERGGVAETSADSYTLGDDGKTLTGFFKGISFTRAVPDFENAAVAKHRLAAGADLLFQK